MKRKRVKKKKLESEIWKVLGVEDLQEKSAFPVEGKFFNETRFEKFPGTHEKVLLKVGARKSKIPKLCKNKTIKRHLSDISESVDEFRYVGGEGKIREFEKIKRLMASLERTIKRL